MGRVDTPTSPARATRQPIQLSSAPPHCLRYTQYIIYFINAAIHIPGCRDIFAPGKALSPDDEKLFNFMKLNPLATPFIWNTWGFWALCLAWMEIMAIYTVAMPFIVIGCVHNLGTVFIFARQESMIRAEANATIVPFLVIFGLKGLALLLSFVV